MNEPLRSYISVSEMSQLLQLSRVRFYSLLKDGIFPSPIKIGNSRPYFDSEGQRICLEVKRTNKGYNGQPILFYNKAVKLKQSTKQTTSKYDFIVDALATLGVSGIDVKQIESAIKRNFPLGTAQVDENSLIQTLFIEFSYNQG